VSNEEAEGRRPVHDEAAWSDEVQGWIRLAYREPDDPTRIDAPRFTRWNMETAVRYGEARERARAAREVTAAAIQTTMRNAANLANAERVARRHRLPWWVTVAVLALWAASLVAKRAGWI
jgi:hypothetical protein